MADKQSQNEKSRVLSSLFWKLLERGGTQGIQFIVQIVLARLLVPEQFGTIAIVMVFIHLAQVFVQSGFSIALVQKKNADKKDFSSIFYLSLGISVIVYIIIYTLSPFISDFYGDPVLIPVLRTLSLILFPGALNSVQNAFVARNMMFKKLFQSSLGAIMISGVFGIFAAYQGLGIWALVIQQLTNHFAISLIMWFTVKWRPEFTFSFNRVRILFSFGSKLLASSLLNVLYLEIRTLIIGRLYSSAILGYYNRGEQFPKIIVNNINGSIQSVMLPTLSIHQDDTKRIKSIMRRAIVSSSYLIFPMMIGLAVIAEPLVIIVLTEKWILAVPFLQLFSISYALMPLHTANLQAINAMGRSDIYLKIEVTKKIIGLIILAISLPFGVFGIAIGQVLSGFIASFINAHPNKELLDYSYAEQLKDVLPSLGISLVMGTVVYLIKTLPLSLSVGWLLILQGTVGFIIYIGLSLLFRIESLNYMVDTVKHILKSKKEASI